MTAGAGGSNRRKEVRIIQFTKEQVDRAAACESAAALQALAKSEGIKLTNEEAESYFVKLTNVHVSDDELDAVAGGTDKSAPISPNDDPSAPISPVDDPGVLNII